MVERVSFHPLRVGGMAHRAYWQPTDRPPGWTAWSASLAVHAALFLAMLYVVRYQLVQGAAEEPIREVGIVLKQASDDGPLFEGEEDQSVTPEQRTPGAFGESTLEALPSDSELPSTDSALPQLPTIGVGALEAGDIGHATAMARGGRTSKSVGGQARVSVFGIEGVGAKFVYVFDRSISMQGAALAAAKQQLVASLDALESVHQFQIIFFNHEPQAWDLTGGQGRIAFATDRNKRLATNFVRGITAQGGTSRQAALRLALSLRSDVVFFLSDADDPMPNVEVADMIRRAQRDDTAIHTIQFGYGPSSRRESFLVQLARGTGGGYIYVDTRQLRR